MKPGAVDAATTALPGPWTHELIVTGTGRFHAAMAGPAAGPLVVLLPSFGQFWWTWRAHIPLLAAAGFRVAAADLRGTGMSDKGPTGYDMFSLTRDVAGLIGSLGAARAVIIGQGVGGIVARSMPALQPEVVRAVGALSAPDPLVSHARRLRLYTASAVRFLAYAQIPWFPERALVRGTALRRLLNDWGAPGWCSPAVANTFTQAMRIPFAAHSGLEIMRWLVRSTWRSDGRSYLAALRNAAPVPTLQLHGELDGAIRVAHAFAAGATAVPIAGAGHYLTEEAPTQVGAHLLEWLSGL